MIIRKNTLEAKLDRSYDDGFLEGLDKGIDIGEERGISKGYEQAVKDFRKKDEDDFWKSLVIIALVAIVILLGLIGYTLVRDSFRDDQIQLDQHDRQLEQLREVRTVSPDEAHIIACDAVDKYYDFELNRCGGRKDPNIVTPTTMPPPKSNEMNGPPLITTPNYPSDSSPYTTSTTSTTPSYYCEAEPMNPNQGPYCDNSQP